MKKLLSAVIVGAGLTVLPAVAQAQSASGSVDASATVLAYLDVQNVADLDFGDISAGSGATLTPGTTPGAGTLGVLQIDHNSEVSVSVALPAGLAHTSVGTAPDLPVSFTCGYSTNASGALAGSAVACSSLGNRTVATNDGDTETSYIQVGGSISSANTTDRVPGTYSGTLTFTVNAIY